MFNVSDSQAIEAAKLRRIRRANRGPGFSVPVHGDTHASSLRHRLVRIFKGKPNAKYVFGDNDIKITDERGILHTQITWAEKKRREIAAEFKRCCAPTKHLKVYGTPHIAASASVEIQPEFLVSYGKSFKDVESQSFLAAIREFPAFCGGKRVLAEGARISAL